MKYAVPYAISATGIMVNKTKVTNPNYSRSYDIFADPQFAGHATMMDEMREVIGCALAYNGYDLNSTDDAELDAAYKTIMTDWKKNLTKFDAEGFGKSFASGDFWLCQGYAEVTYGEVPEEKWEDTIDFFIPEEGGPAYLDSMMILKDAKHYDLANEFINYIYKPENYAMFLDFFCFPDYIVPEARQYMHTTPHYEASAMDKCVLKMDIGADLDKYNSRWQEIRFSAD